MPRTDDRRRRGLRPTRRRHRSSSQEQPSQRTWQDRRRDRADRPARGCASRARWPCSCSSGATSPTCAPSAASSAPATCRRRATPTWSSARAAAKAALGDQVVRARPPLPARRGHPVRRRDRRLVQAGAAGGGRPGVAVHRVLRRALHGRVRRHPHRRRTSRWSCPTSPPAARWPTWPRSSQVEECWDVLVDAGVADVVGPGLVHELLRRHQGVHRPARRHDLHVVQRQARAGVGLRAGREGAVPARPAPRPQHRRLQMGMSLDDCVLYDPHKPRRRADGRAAAGRADDPVARPLLGARPVQPRLGATTCASGSRA